MLGPSPPSISNTMKNEKKTFMRSARRPSSALSVTSPTTHVTFMCIKNRPFPPTVSTPTKKSKKRHALPTNAPSPAPPVSAPLGHSTLDSANLARAYHISVEWIRFCSGPKPTSGTQIYYFGSLWTGISKQLAKFRDQW
jgi:hypothetical protein